MRQMVLRFFLYTWGAILGTTLLVIGLAISFGLPPPGHVPVEAVARLIQDEAREVYARGGRAGFDAMLAGNPDMAEQLIPEDASSAACTGPALIGTGADGSCLLLNIRPGQPAWLRVILPFVVPMTTGAGVSLLIAFALAHRFVRPVQRISDGLAALSNGRLDQRIGPELTHSEPAIADVGRAFDTAADKLQQLTEGRSRLFHDISHEIRSPLARLQAELALLQRNPARLPALLPRMEADIRRMDHLVGEILMLARLERGGTAAISPVALDLIDILDPILRDAELEGHERQIAIRYAGPEHLCVTCDPELLHRAFENILRNALRYAPAGSQVDVAVSATARDAEITISDRGPGVEATQIPAIFQAFVRDAGGSGTGLGLAIAANALRLHGGTIRAENREGGGLTILSQVPLRPRD